MSRAELQHSQLYTHLIHESTLPLRPEITDIYRDLPNVENNLERSLVKHRETSKRVIKTAAQVALKNAPKDKPKTALILGAGDCDDIPLKWIGHTFDKITLVEINSNATEEVVAQLPEKAQKKIQIIKADIAGNTAAMMREINLAKKRPSLEEFVYEAGNAIKTVPLDGIPPSFGQEYTFVSSHLVMSQLPGLPITALQTYFAEHYGRSLESLDHEQKMHLFKDLYIPSSAVIEEHIAYLANSVSRQGIVHLSDTAMDEGPDNSDWMIPPQAVTKSLSEHFDVLEPGTIQWDWQHKPEYTYKVVAYPLRRKQAV